MKKYTDVKITFQTEKMIKSAIKQLITEERRSRYACERTRTDELDKAVCQIQKEIRSIKVKVNRLASEADK